MCRADVFRLVGAVDCYRSVPKLLSCKNFLIPFPCPGRQNWYVHWCCLISGVGVQTRATPPRWLILATPEKAKASLLMQCYKTDRSAVGKDVIEERASVSIRR